ncbi:MAG: hypothetical protein V7707_18945 [Motiliproteus sp.]
MLPSSDSDGSHVHHLIEFGSCDEAQGELIIDLTYPQADDRLVAVSDH